MRKCAEAWIESLKREKLMWEKCFWFDQAGAFFFFLSVWVYFGKRYKLWRARTATEEVISLTLFHILILWHFVSGFTALGKSPRLKAGPRSARTVVSSLHLLPPFSRALGPLLPAVGSGRAVLLPDAFGATGCLFGLLTGLPSSIKKRKGPQTFQITFPLLGSYWAQVRNIITCYLETQAWRCEVSDKTEKRLRKI